MRHAAAYLRISHNGNPYEGNPHWAFGFGRDGALIGEVIRGHTRYDIEEQLAESDVAMLFDAADAMSSQFPPVEQHVGHHFDDVCIQCRVLDKIIYRYVVPPREQQRPPAVQFLAVLARVIAKRAASPARAADGVGG